MPKADQCLHAELGIVKDHYPGFLCFDRFGNLGYIITDNKQRTAGYGKLAAGGEWSLIMY